MKDVSAQQILDNLRDDKWGWLGIKRFVPETHVDIESRYRALEKHHEEETTALISTVRRLCEQIVGERKGQNARVWMGPEVVFGPNVARILIDCPSCRFPMPLTYWLRDHTAPLSCQICRYFEQYAVLEPETLAMIAKHYPRL